MLRFSSVAYVSNTLADNYIISDVLSSDLNGDGNVDIVLRGSFFPDVRTAIDECRTLLSDGHGGFSVPSNDRATLVGQPALSFAQKPTLADINRDGYLDLFYTGQWQADSMGYEAYQKSGVLCGDGFGSLFCNQNTLITAPRTGWNAYVLADMNRDGKVDTVFPGPLVYLGRGNGTFFLGTSLPAWITSIPVVSDINRDGWPDVIASQVADAPSFIYVNDGTGKSYSANDTLAGQLFADVTSCNVAAGDINGDGLGDYASVSTNCPWVPPLEGKRAYVFISQPAGGISAGTPLLLPAAPTSMGTNVSPRWSKIASVVITSSLPPATISTDRVRESFGPFAGSAPAGATVVVMEGALQLAKTVANSSGQWTAVLPSATAAGWHPLEILTSDPVSGSVSEPLSALIKIVTAGQWKSSRNPLDVNDDTFVAPNDALQVINYINAAQSGPVPLTAAAKAPYLDTSGDDFSLPNDAFNVINYINAHPGNFNSGGEGEGSFREVERLSAPADLSPTMDMNGLDVLMVESWVWWAANVDGKSGLRPRKRMANDS